MLDSTFSLPASVGHLHIAANAESDRDNGVYGGAGNREQNRGHNVIVYRQGDSYAGNENNYSRR